MLFLAVTNFLTYPISYVIIPYELKQVIGFSSQQYGVLQAFFMIGILAGNLVVGSFFLKAGARKLMRIGISGAGGGHGRHRVHHVSFRGQFPGRRRVAILLGVRKRHDADRRVQPRRQHPDLHEPSENGAQFHAVEVLLHDQHDLTAGRSRRFASVWILLDLVPVHFLVLGIGIATLSAIFIFLTTAPEESYEPTVVKTKTAQSVPPKRTARSTEAVQGTDPRIRPCKA